MPGNGQKRWTSIAAESVAIVVSILLAFAIDAWWEERKEREYEQEALSGLKSEYEDHRQVIEWQIDFHTMSLRAIAGLMAGCQTGDYQSSEFTVDKAMYYLGVPLTTDLGNGVRDAIISAGRIEVIQDRELRYQLAEWDSVVDELYDGQEFNRDYVRETLYPYLNRNGIPHSGPSENEEGRPWPVTPRYLSDHPETLASLFGDPEFCSILDFRYSHMDHTRSEYDRVLESINRILDQINQSFRVIQ